MDKMTLAAMVPLCSAIFFAGYQSNRIDSLFTKIHAAEREMSSTRDIILDIHGRVCSIEQRINDFFTK